MCNFCKNYGENRIFGAAIPIQKCSNETNLTDARCSKCNRLLGKFNGQAEIKCPKCGKINRIGVKRL